MRMFHTEVYVVFGLVFLVNGESFSFGVGRFDELFGLSSLKIMARSENLPSSLTQATAAEPLPEVVHAIASSAPRRR